MKTRVSQSVTREIVRIFGESAANSLIQELEGANLPLTKESADRIHMAILLGSEGKPETFRDLLKLSSIDWRDTLVKVGLANDNWREVLKSKGYWSPA
jgi:hypothetical protein